MQKSNNRFNKPRTSDKKSPFKSGEKKEEKRRTFKPRKDDDQSSKSRFDKKERFSDKPYPKKEGKGTEKRSFSDKNKNSRPFDPDKKPVRKKFNDADKKFDKPFRKREGDSGEKRSFNDRDNRKKFFDSDEKFDKTFKKRNEGKDEKRSYSDKEKKFKSSDHSKKPYDRAYKKTYKKNHDEKHMAKVAKSQIKKHDDDLIRLNKYLSNAGVCSRREADELIKAGAVSVNGKVITEMGYRVNPTDKISYGGETLKHEKKVYLILNKPKDYLTTTDDPRERRTVMELIQGACKERVYPVGRLDRNTTGLLLFTNDGEMATKLMHPKFGIRKVYHVLLDKKMKPDDLASLREGVELEDGFIKPDEVSYTGETKKEIGIEIHSGKNRIVRRIFEHLGYEVIKLDRVVFASLTKKDLPRGKWRILSDKEIGFLKMIG